MKKKLTVEERAIVFKEQREFSEYQRAMKKEKNKHRVEMRKQQSLRWRAA